MSDLATALKRHLFADPEAKVYAVLDGASVPDLLKKLHALKPEHICLYRGALAPDLAECAPYLIRLIPESPFAQWVLAEGWGKHWGIFSLTQADLKAMRKHFRTFLRVKSPEGKTLYFRYYDPRVLRVYLPTCNEQELKVLFGPVVAYCLEDKLPVRMLRFGRPEAGGRLLETKIPLSDAALGMTEGAA